MLEYNGFFVSLDKIKLRCRVEKSHLKKHFRIFDNVDGLVAVININPSLGFSVVNEFNSTKVFGYRNLYTICSNNEKEGVLTVGSCFNGTWNSPPKPNEFFFEFNPNKKGKLIYEWFCSKLCFTILEISSFDIAYDMPNQYVSNVGLSTTCNIMTYGTVNNSTLYISPKEDRSGRVKVYQKDIERHKHNIDIVPTVRIECTVKLHNLHKGTNVINNTVFDELDKCVNRLNSVYFRNINYDDWAELALSFLDTTQLSLVLSRMSKNTRYKYINSLKSKSLSLALDVNTFYLHCLTLLKPYTERN